MSGVIGTVELTAAWFNQQYGIVEPNPFKASLDELAEHQAKKQVALGTFWRCGSRQRKTCYGISHRTT